MKRISNYEELVAARRMTEAIITDKRQDIHQRVENFIEKIAPLLSLLNMFKNKATKSNSLLKMGGSLAIDLLIGQKLLRKAGWITRLVVPTLLRVVSSKVIENAKK